MFIFDAQLSTVVESPDSASKPVASVAGPLSPELLDRMHRYWQAANYLTVGQIYLRENVLLREPLRAEHIKPRLLGHWGTSSGLNFIYAHLNRLIQQTGASVLYIAGPGHGGPALNANSFLEGTYSAVHPEITRDTSGIRLLFREFSTPGGVPSHCGPHLPSSINEGGELGYSLLHAFGAAFDNPDLIVACVVGDGEAETGPLEGSWKSNRFLNPARDGAVLPILHLNGYKISGPTVEGRTRDDELTKLYLGHGYQPHLVEGDDPATMHQQFAATLDSCYAEIRAIQAAARRSGPPHNPDGQPVSPPLWPMILLRSPKGWTGPKEVDGVPIEGTFRAHQVPLATVRENPHHLRLLEAWMKSYHPESLFDHDGNFAPELQALAPRDNLRMGANPSANGGRVLNALSLPDFANYALEVPAPGCVIAESPRKLGEFFRDVIKSNPENFRLFCPDETNSNRLNAVFEATDRCMIGESISIDDHVSAKGRVMEVLSEHCCEGWLEGYLLSGRHGVWATYEGFAQVVDSMLTQHGKWLEQCEELPWRRPVASLNIFLTSHCWRNDHNGFSHQAPGFVDNALARRSTITRIYYPPDANTLLSTFDHCLRTRNYINLVTCGKQEQLQWLAMDQAIEHCSRGASRWEFASNDKGADPDVILACVGDVPTLETVAASWLLQKYVPEIRVRLINVVDLTVLMSPDEHPHGMDALSFEDLFTQSAPVVFVYHGYRWAIHSMIHGRPNEARFHVRGFLDQGSTTTPFDMVVRNKISRYHLVMDALKYVPRIRSKRTDVVDLMNRKLFEHHAYIREHFEDLPEVALWRWTSDFSESHDPLPLAKGQPRAQLFTDG
jgi:xylulose-5-phosphate/fructose-6-phosphate phosphoketolase